MKILIYVAILALTTSFAFKPETVEKSHLSLKVEDSKPIGDFKK